MNFEDTLGAPVGFQRGPEYVKNQLRSQFLVVAPNVALISICRKCLTTLEHETLFFTRKDKGDHGIIRIAPFWDHSQVRVIKYHLLSFYVFFSCEF